ncbi:hypothetical protein ACJJTC_013583 [Scirpophaga incertulas]
MLHYRTSTVRRKETDTRLRIIHTKIYKSLLNETTKHFLDEEKSRDSVAFCVLNDRDQREKSEDQDLALYKQGARFGNHSVHLCVTVRSTLLSLSPSEGNIWPHNMPNMLHYRTSTVRRKETDTRLRIIHTKIYKSLLNETTKHFLDEEHNLKVIERAFAVGRGSRLALMTER